MKGKSDVKEIGKGIGLLILLSLPPIVAYLEATMAAQMFLQMPGLIISGMFIGRGLKTHWPRLATGFNHGGIPGILLVTIVASYWMLPRAIDASLVNPWMEIAKYTSLPLLVGIPLVLSWPKMGFITKSFIWTNLISMFIVMAWLYLAAPIRLCNSYLTSQQQVVGWIFLLLTAVSVFMLAIPAFVGKKTAENKQIDTNLR